MILKILYGFDRISQERNENQQIFAVIDKKNGILFIKEYRFGRKNIEIHMPLSHFNWWT